MPEQKTHLHLAFRTARNISFGRGRKTWNGDVYLKAIYWAGVKSQGKWGQEWGFHEQGCEKENLDGESIYGALTKVGWVTTGKWWIENSKMKHRGEFSEKYVVSEKYEM